MVICPFSIIWPWFQRYVASMTISSLIYSQAVRLGFSWWRYSVDGANEHHFENQTREQNPTGLKRRKIRKFVLDFMSLFFVCWRNWVHQSLQISSALVRSWTLVLIHSNLSILMVRLDQLPVKEQNILFQPQMSPIQGLGFHDSWITRTHCSKN